MARTLTYTNDFDGNENIPGSLSVELRPGQNGGTGNNIGIRNSASTSDPDAELQLFQGDQVGGYAEFADESFDVANGLTATNFAFSTTIDIINLDSGNANSEPDGFSFNFGDTATLPPVGDGVTTALQGALEQGVSEGLAVRVIPIADQMQIVWNGTVLSTITVTNLTSRGAETFAVEVSDTGLVTVTYGATNFTGQIPNEADGTSGLAAADQTDWGFSLAGRTGGADGEIWADDLSLTANLVCFCEGTLIETADGLTPVEDLCVGDLVKTMDNGLQPVRWTGRNALSSAHLYFNDNLRPIRIKAGALGDGQPLQDLTVSPQHRMLVRSAVAQKMFGESEVLVAAKQLVLLDGIDVAKNVEKVTYVHFMCDRHEVVFANGAPSESLFTGPEALKSVPDAAHKEILAIFPELMDVDFKASGARHLVNGRKGRQLAVRHKNNRKQLLTAP